MAENPTYYPEGMDYPVGAYWSADEFGVRRERSAAPEWFRLTREAAPDVPADPVSENADPTPASAVERGAVRQFLARLAESRGALGR